MQQSALLSQFELANEESSLQLFSPQIKYPWQSSSPSQSPPPTPHGAELEQHPQFVLEMPPQAAVGVNYEVILINGI